MDHFDTVMTYIIHAFRFHDQDGDCDKDGNYSLALGLPQGSGLSSSFQGQVGTSKRLLGRDLRLRYL